MMRHLMGSALMGIGGVLALGCTVGQGMERRLDARSVGALGDGRNIYRQGALRPPLSGGR